MKIFLKLSRVLGLVLCIFLSQTAFAQTNFYYSPDGKTSLEVSHQKILVKFAEGTSFDAQQQLLDKVKNIGKLEREMMLPAPKVTIVPLEGISSNSQVVEILELLKKNPKVDHANVFLAHQDGTLHGIQEKLLVRIKSNKDISRFNQIMDQFEVIVESRNEFDPLLFHVAVLPESSLNALELANKLHESGNFDYAEPDFLRLMKKMNTNDPFVNSQWSLNNDGVNTGSYGGIAGSDMKVFAAWTASTGTNIKVAIIDEGVDLTHPDLAGNMLGGYDATGQGSNGGMQGNDAHGTACAGIVASVGNNNTGTVGVAYDSKILPVRIAYTSGTSWVTSNAWIGNALNWSWQTGGADVLSNSWGGGGSSSTINNAIDAALSSGRGGLGAPVLFAAGNDNGANSYPATYAPTISVIAMSMCNQRKSPSSCDGETWWGSNFGTGADVAAPGVKIYATDISGSAGYSSGDYTATFNGTSSACPNSAGVMALILAADPSLTAAQARFALESTCDKTGGYSYNNNGNQPNGTWSNDLGYGRVNATSALAYVNGGGPTCSDGIQNGDEEGVDCGGSFCQACPCTGNTVTLSITFDNYPEETSWTIQDSNGATVASGGTYGGQADGSTLTLDECLADGCYDFTINDTYGDGICCGYGNGSYTLTDAASNVLASGGQFTNSETTNFCLNGNPPDPCDVPASLSAAPSGVDVSLTWNAATGANDYNVQIREVGAATWTSFNNTASPLNLTGLVACTDYEFQVQSNCTSETSAWSASSTFMSDGCTGGCTYVNINSNTFESGWGIWNDGGSDCRRSNRDANYAIGTYCIRLRDNTSTSTMTTDNLDLSSYDELTVDFSFVARSMDNSNEDFWLQISTNGGSSYTTVGDWNQGVEFSNGPRYNETVVIAGPFTANSRLRFRCDASGNSDWIYIDDVVITGCSSTGSSAPIPTTAPIAATISKTNIDLNLFPNPTRSELNLAFEMTTEEDIQVMMTDYTGKVIESRRLAGFVGTHETAIDVNKYAAGFYFVTLITESQRLTKKFVVID